MGADQKLRQEMRQEKIVLIWNKYACLRVADSDNTSTEDLDGWGYANAGSMFVFEVSTFYGAFEGIGDSCC